MPETTDHPRLTPKFTEALAYTRMLHADQIRKGTGGTPYIAHLMSTAALVLEDGGSEDEAIAALLHDALEDQADRTSEQEIAELFGPHVADIVVECSDREPGEDLNWRERKERYLASIGHKSACALRVSNADKLHNARSIVRDLREHGDKLFERFQKDGQELSETIDNQLWYYRSLAVAFFEHHRGPLADGLVHAVDEMIDLAGPSLAPSDTDGIIEEIVKRFRKDLQQADAS